MKKCDIVLLCQDDEQKAHAYQIMGYHLIEYKKKHCISHAKALELMKHGYINDYTEVEVMY